MNIDKLSQSCKQEVMRFSQARRQTRPRQGGAASSIGGIAGPSIQLPLLSYEGRFIQEGDDTSKTPRSLESNMSISLPVYKKDKNSLAFSLKGGNLNLESPVSLGSGTVIDRDWYRSEVGIHYSRRLDGKKMFGLSSSFGYEGDNFSPETQNISLRANYSFPTEGGNRWVLMLLMSNNGQLGNFIPIPGFFYITRTSTFTGIFGFPVLSLQWTPVNPWAFSFSLFGANLRAESSYGVVNRRQFFIASGMKQQRYMYSERTNEDDRLTFEEKFFELGIRQPILKGSLIEFQTGSSFDRSLYLGDGLFNKDRGEGTFDSSLYARFFFKVIF
ncbi:conserved hypothetical protein [Halobacteriovorax marinus SJ]|uniref:Uncharacterized protein n=1 Tax=Halobacteriovorax marinus (strain ATCC BAA-682 / DSM 15412 / SJ) TaxID=862908 RepID=E1X3I8_HALMS|nr:conserved hypothetical protein [Halobacteriovorax marinus SJ]